MRGSLALAVMILAAGFAGCIGAQNEKPDEPLTNMSDQTVLDANESTSAPDGRGEIAAFKETNRTEAGTGSMEHMHDYWGSATRREILTLEAGLIPLPIIPCRNGAFPGGDCYSPGTAIADLDIPEPNLVYEGTDHIEILFTKVRPFPAPEGVPHPLITIYVDYLTAADEPDAWRQGGQITPDTPLVIKVGPRESDMPHQTKSLWLFRIYTGEPNGFLFNMTVTAVKGAPVVDWPPHPDLYAQRPDREILNGAFRTQTKGYAEYWLNGADANWIYPERVISYGTDRVEVTVEKGGMTLLGAGPAVEPTEFFLEYRNASYLSKMGNGDLVGGRVFDAASDGTTYRFTIPVDPNGMDTPYGVASRWAFRFVARYGDDASCPSPGLTQGCQWFPYTLDYTMRIVAFGHSTANEATPDPAAAT